MKLCCDFILEFVLVFDTKWQIFIGEEEPKVNKKSTVPGNCERKCYF